MSKSYEMMLTVSEVNLARLGRVQGAITQELGVNPGHWERPEVDQLSITTRLCLAGGETEGEFSKRLARFVWTENGGPCNVEVVLTCLEDLPYNRYTFTSEDRRLLRWKTPA